ncbi:MAG: hypothetical protein KAT20_05680, partial [Desulfuromonadales bacterium]|nr:hypothetical protein [Desulfuromonadales bacterium]
MNEHAETKLDRDGSQNPGPQHAGDEIDLVQLWLVLLKRKYIILAVITICLLSGAAFVLQKPVTYPYTTTIEIGSIEGGRIESPDVVLVKLEKIIIPRGIRNYSDEHGGGLPGVKTGISKNSQLLTLTSYGSEEMANPFSELHQLILGPLFAEHRRIINVPQREYRLQVDKAKLVLKDLENPRIFTIEEQVLKVQLVAARMKAAEFDDQEKLLVSQGKRLIETQSLLEQQIIKVKENVAQAFASRPKAVSQVGDATQAMTLMMISNQIEQNDNRLAALQERLSIGLENEKQELEIQGSANRRALELQKAKIIELQSRLVKLKAQR